MKTIQIGKRIEDCLDVTDEQAQAFNRTIERQGLSRYKGAYYDQLNDCLMVNFGDIVIGIETDGHTHS